MGQQAAAETARAAQQLLEGLGGQHEQPGPLGAGHDAGTARGAGDHGHVLRQSVDLSLSPDTWAIDQLFPVLPIQRLHERPTALGSFADLTCDSDGKLERFIDRGQVKPLLELHALQPGEPYWIGLFLAGAYQEVMGNLHNLFGSTNSVHIRLQASGGYSVDHVVRGNTNAEVLKAMEHSPELLLERLRVASEAAIGRGQLKISEASRLMAHLEASLGQSTYLQS